MRYYLFPLILSLLLCANVRATFERDMKIIGCTLCCTSTVALSVLTYFAGYGTVLLGKFTSERLASVDNTSTVPLACVGIVATSVATGATALGVGMTYEAGAYSVSMLRSSERPPVILLRFVGGVLCKLFTMYSGDYH